jgi:hypothetical protein
VRVLAVFAGDFTYVRAAGDTVPKGAPDNAWMVRGALEWEPYLAEILRYYDLGRPVPAAFTPVRKLPSELVGALARLPGPALTEAFAKLRAEGLLPPLRPLARETCPAALPWEDLRARFQDFSRDDRFQDFSKDIPLP